MACGQIFKVLWKSKNRNGHHSSFCHIFRTSHYYIVVLLMLSFSCLMVLPSLFWSISIISGAKLRGVALFVVLMAAILSDTVDAGIYVFKYPCVRRQLIRKFPYIFYCCRKTRTSAHRVAIKLTPEEVEVAPVNIDNLPGPAVVPQNEESKDDVILQRNATLPLHQQETKSTRVTFHVRPQRIVFMTPKVMPE